MPIFGWIRDALGIHKDNVEIDKVELEITKLEDEEVARHLITPATMEDIKNYDPAYQKLDLRIRAERRLRDRPRSDHRAYSSSRLLVWLIIFLSILLACGTLIVPEVRKWLGW